MIKTVFFDWGGVIASDPGDDFLASLLRKIGANESQIADIFQTTMRQFTRGSLDESQFWTLLDEKYKLHVPSNISSEFKNWKGLIANKKVLALVKELQSKGFQVAVLSNVIEPSYKIIQKAGYYELFDELIVSCKIGAAKPEKEIYEIAIKMAGVKPDECLFIDDKQFFLDPAEKLGMQTILASNPEQIIRDAKLACGII